MSRSTNSEFLARLGDLFSSSEQSGSVYLTQKRLISKESENESTPFGVLFRATNGKDDKKQKVKLSTVVDSADLDTFWAQYTEVMKSGMGGLKKKEKKKKNKSKK